MGRWTNVNIWSRFWAKTAVQPRGCIDWIGVHNGSGYGQFFSGRTTEAGKKRMDYAHRWLYEQVVGPIPSGMELDHLCRRPCCVNPFHVEVVTPRINKLRGNGVAARNAAVTHCPQGHAYDEQNTYRSKKGSRICRRCAREKQAARVATFVAKHGVTPSAILYRRRHPEAPHRK
jgi:hypothetical protein